MNKNFTIIGIIIVIVLFIAVFYIIQQPGSGEKPIAGTECESNDECAFVIYSAGCTPLEKQCQSLAEVDVLVNKGICNKEELKIDESVQCECKTISPENVFHTGPKKACSRVEQLTR